MIRQLFVLLTDFRLVLNANESMLSTSQGLLLMGAIFLLAGLVVVYSQGKTAFARARQYLGAESLGAETASASGPVAVSGTIVTDRETVPGPVSGDDCVIYEDTEQVYKRDYRYDRDRRREMKRSSMYDDEEAEERLTTWHTTAADEAYVPFFLESDHGRVAVDPADARLDLPERAVDQSSLLRRLFHRFTFFAVFGRLLGMNPKRHVETHVKPGDEIHVIARANASEGATDTVAEIEHSDGPFVISTRSKTSLAVRNFCKAFFASLPGLLFVVLGGVFLVGSLFSAGVL